MTVKELREQLNKLGEHYDSFNVSVKVFSPGSWGGTPVVGIKGFSLGFDWDNHKFMFITEQEVVKLNREDKRDIIIDDITK